MSQVETLMEALNKRGARRGFSNTRHGHATVKNETNTYESWQGMKRRCDNPKRPDYKYYGGRGISYCKRWSSFHNFLADMGECPKGLTLERENNNLDYSPNNCKWATRLEQRMNNSFIRLLTFGGKTMCVRNWERELGFCNAGITMRLKRGWSVEKSLTIPPRKT